MTPTPGDVDFQVTYQNQICLILLPPLFTVTEAVAFKKKFQEICQTEQAPTRIVLDFGQTSFIDSSGIGALVSCQKSATSHEIEMILWSPSPQVQMVLSLTGLDEFFAIDKSTKAVLPNDVTTNKDVPVITHPSVRSRVKRLVDILGALVGLSITGVLLIPLAIAIKLDSPGPIFFGQTRCGWMGRRFKLWKFRSMVANAGELKHLVENQVQGPIFKNANDPRITKVGQFLRRTSLDELPQFWNVLRGEMSLVGTRPPTPDEIDIYEVPEWRRLDVKPGMTGEWQVHGRSKVTSFEEVIRLDLRYQENWSLMYDFNLIFKTIWVIFRKDSGAF
jgi:anti-anti-sigma factor